MKEAKINTIAQWFKIISVCIIIIGFILIALWLFYTFSESNIEYINAYSITLNSISYIITILIIALIFRGVGEIIQLLEDIKNKIK